LFVSFAVLIVLRMILTFWASPLLRKGRGIPHVARSTPPLPTQAQAKYGQGHAQKNNLKNF
ncbi:MAG: hypothetical protein NZ551_03555, partial [Microscillaceae bacterium]|nr:hypothetical protein [Microscillaceae bacterium]MDW8460264.1 hypothetical protein [Cytophagales bacterium]